LNKASININGVKFSNEVDFFYKKYYYNEVLLCIYEEVLYLFNNTNYLYRYPVTEPYHNHINFKYRGKPKDKPNLLKIMDAPLGTTIDKIELKSRKDEYKKMITIYVNKKKYKVLLDTQYDKNNLELFKQIATLNNGKYTTIE